jgi:ferrous-iron efflux pump FieF
MYFQTQNKDQHNPRYALLASAWAIGTVTILILIKSYAYYISDSTAMLATLIDSVIDVAVSLMMLFAVRLSLKPADSEHRHGHGKVEGIAALMQGAFMAGAGLFLFFESLNRFSNPVLLANHGIAIGIAGTSIFLSLLLLMVQRYCLKRAPSLAIEADHAHYKNDILLNGSVIVALLIAQKTGIGWLDPLLSIFIAACFLFTAWRITNLSLDMLMDRELPAPMRQRIADLANNHPEIFGMHDLRTRMSGMNFHISFDVELEPSLSLQRAHDIIRALDHKILEEFPNAEIIIHMDPRGDIADPRHNMPIMLDS